MEPQIDEPGTAKGRNEPQKDEVRNAGTKLSVLHISAVQFVNLLFLVLPFPLLRKREREIP
ncbi:MAG: hypothetical protein ACYC4N_21355 [Pirellulaceae bacterium]